MFCSTLPSHQWCSLPKGFNFNHFIPSIKTSKFKGLSGLTFNLRNAPNGGRGVGEERVIFSALLSFLSFLFHPLPLSCLRLHAALKPANVRMCALFIFFFASFSEIWQTILSRLLRKKHFRLTTGNCRRCELTAWLNSRKRDSCIKLKPR